MSLYALDKLIWLMAHNEDRRLLDQYLADPASVLEGRDLSQAERAAVKDCDISALYRMGVQPFILLGWTRRVAAARGEDSDAFIHRYAAAVKPHGRPDYST